MIKFKLKLVIVLLSLSFAKYPEAFAVVIPEVLKASCNVENTEIYSESEDKNAYGISTVFVQTTVHEGQSATITFEIPDGWSDIAIQQPDIDPQTVNARTYKINDDEEEAWLPLIAANSFGLTVGNSITLPPSSDTYDLRIYLVDNDRIYMAKRYSLEATVTNKILTFSDSICIDTFSSDYYTLQGTRVSKPEKGVYIRVRNGVPAAVIF
ncbi:MAG: hypothetical protein K2J15_05195 [Muribaculaceae bacterium]|nr:hypothetical protein [Muribaculaceae bacterium]